MLYFNIDTTSYEFKIYLKIYTGKCDTINTGVIIEKKNVILKILCTCI